jgi:uncharacterized protein YcgI (DUF1989 family)
MQRERALTDFVLGPKKATALELAPGQRLRITDIDGKQVVDLALWNRENLREKLSTSYSRSRFFPEPGSAFKPRMQVREGDWLMSTACRPMATVTRESPSVKGVHGVHHRMCNRFFYASHGKGMQDGCLEHIAAAISPWGLRLEDVPDSFDVFQNYPYDCERGHFTVLEPITQPGDFWEIRAELNLLVALSNCPDDSVAAANGWRCTPTRIQVFEGDGDPAAELLDPTAWLEAQLSARGLPR